MLMNTATDNSNYWIMDTDYTTFSAVWSCEVVPEIENASIEGYWLLSRTPNMDINPVVKAKIDFLTNQYIDKGHVRITKQTTRM